MHRARVRMCTILTSIYEGALLRKRVYVRGENRLFCERGCSCYLNYAAMLMLLLLRLSRVWSIYRYARLLAQRNFRDGLDGEACGERGFDWVDGFWARSGGDLVTRICNESISNNCSSKYGRI